jgi:hypothetical protein
MSILVVAGVLGVIRVLGARQIPSTASSNEPVAQTKETQAAMTPTVALQSG